MCPELPVLQAGGRCDLLKIALRNLCGASLRSRSTGSKIPFSAFAAKSVGDANGGWRRGPVNYRDDPAPSGLDRRLNTSFLPKNSYWKNPWRNPMVAILRDHRTRGTRSSRPRRGSQISNGHLHASPENINACAPLSRAILRTHPPAGASRQRSR